VYRTRLPAIVVHPETHAAGELKWHRTEAPLAADCMPRWRNRLVRTMLETRSFVQRADAGRINFVIAPSGRFAREYASDYGFAPAQMQVVPNPVDLRRHSPREQPPSNGRVRLVFVARMAVRKGVEMIVELSHRLDDLADEVEILSMGDHSQWSDYRPLLERLNPRVARYIGPLEPSDLAEVLADSDAALQPSRYEPFALTVAEALASGVPVIASDAVGASEFVDRRAAIEFPNGDLAALERATRELVTSARAGAGLERRTVARHEAERLFAPSVVGGLLKNALAAAAAR
jgi:glycosyltransferase involved in cell wall biosynthesis